MPTNLMGWVVAGVGITVGALIAQLVLGAVKRA